MLPATEPRYRTLRAEGREWRHHERLQRAFLRGLPTDASVFTAEADEPSAADEGVEWWKLWAQPPDRLRAEFAVGRDIVEVVFHGDTWWSYWPSYGWRTNGGRRDFEHGIGPGEVLVHPPALAGEVDVEPIGDATFLARAVRRVRAVPRRDRPGSAQPSFALHALGAGADEYELLVDAESGLLLRSEARLDGEAFRVVEVTALWLDEDIDPVVFTIEPPEGTAFAAVDPPPAAR